MTLEEQRKEAQKDETGKIRKYLVLADRLSGEVPEQPTPPLKILLATRAFPK
jgi:hypothetical protein